LLPAISTFGELTRQLQDQFIGAGECLSSRIVQAAFVQAGVDAVWLDARECIVTDAAHTQATPLWDETNQRVRDAVGLARASAVPVIGGFIGSTSDGIPTRSGVAV
jgi:aspartate kinase